MRHLVSHLRYSLPLGALCSSLAISASATDKALLDILFGNGLITDAQYEQLLQQEEVTTAEVLSSVTLALPVQSKLSHRFLQVMAQRAFDSKRETVTGRPICSGERSFATAIPTDLTLGKWRITRTQADPALSNVDLG